MSNLPKFSVCFLLIISSLMLGPVPSQATSTPEAHSSVTDSLPKTTTLLRVPIEAKLVEQPAQALSVWRQFRASKPTLVLLSQDPFLLPVPETLRKEAIELIQTGSLESLAEKTSASNSDPLLLPSMAVSSALQSGLFAKVVWVLPTTVPNEQLNVDRFRQQLLDLGAISPNEAQSLVKHDGRIDGSVRGLPFQAVSINALPDLDGPVLLHIDLGYFKPLYKGEIKTKLYPLLYNTCKALQAKNWDASAATISYSNTSGALPLAVRFIGPTLASLLENPERLTKPMPLNWQKRAKALYLPNFLQTEKERDLYLEMEADLPESPAVKYALYQVSRKTKEGTKALEYLAKAVEIDPVYALEYLSLASTAEEKNLSEQALKMMLHINQALPDNPFITMQVATRLNSLGHTDQALQSIKKLQQLPWSKVYYPNMPDGLAALEASIKSESSE